MSVDAGTGGAGAVVASALSEPARLAVLAPGKAMVVGEYAVLEGAPGVVAAVDCYARARLSEGPAGSPFISAAMEEAAALLGAAGRQPVDERLGVPRVDTSAFSRDGRKLGVGSSAAATVAALGLLCAAGGLDVTDPAVRRQIAERARQAHDRAQGVRGSGADVLAATWGGLRVLHGEGPAEPLALPPGLLLRLVATGQSASTADLVGRYRRARAEAAAQTAAAIAGLAAAARAFIAACRGGDGAAAMAALAAAGQGYDALGAAMGCALVTDEHRQIMAAAEAAGGAAKPSGAGGGDLAIALLPDGAAAAAFAGRLPASLQVLELTISEPGVHVVGAP